MHVYTYTYIETYLGDTVGKVPDTTKNEYCNKVSHTHFFGFPGHLKIMFTLYYSLLSVQ